MYSSVLLLAIKGFMWTDTNAQVIKKLQVKVISDPLITMNVVVTL